MLDARYCLPAIVPLKAGLRRGRWGYWLLDQNVKSITLYIDLVPKKPHRSLLCQKIVQFSL